MQRNHHLTGRRAEEQIERAHVSQWKVQADAVAQDQVDLFSKVRFKGSGVAHRSAIGLSHRWRRLLTQLRVALLVSQRLPDRSSGHEDDLQLLEPTVGRKLQRGRLDGRDDVQQRSFGEHDADLRLLRDQRLDEGIDLGARGALPGLADVELQLGTGATSQKLLH